MRELEKRKQRLLRLPSVENWTRNNRPRFDDTLFALANFDRNPPQFGLREVRTFCALFAQGRISFRDVMEKIEAIRHPAVRASARQVLPGLAAYLKRTSMEGLEAFHGFRITYPIGPRPGGGTLAIPITPTFVGLRNDALVPVFVIPWAKLSFNDFQKRLMSSILKDALLSHQEFIRSDCEIVAFPKIENDDVPEDVRYECSWGVRSYASMDREDLDRQFSIFGRALNKVIEDMVEEE
jgi:hypothetical protein